LALSRRTGQTGYLAVLAYTVGEIGTLRAGGYALVVVEDVVGLAGKTS